MGKCGRNTPGREQARKNDEKRTEHVDSWIGLGQFPLNPKIDGLFRLSLSSIAWPTFPCQHPE